MSNGEREREPSRARPLVGGAPGAASAPAPPGRREHYLDACRAGLMLLGVPVHAAIMYMPRHMYLPGQPSTVSSPDTAPVLGWIAWFVFSFRMQVFFLVAGYFSLLLIRKAGPGAWLRGRATRLCLPLIAAGVLVGPANLVIGECGRAVSLGLPVGAVLTSGFLRFPPWGAAWIAHLWFLVDLMVLSAAFALAWRYAPRRAGSWAEAAAAFATRRPLRAALVAFPIWGAFQLAVGAASLLAGERGTDILGVLNPFRVVAYAPFFALGALLARRPGAMTAFASLSPRGLVLASLPTLVALLALGGGHGHVGKIVFYALWPASGVMMGRLVLSLARHGLDRPSRALRLLVESSYTVYLVHLPIVLGLGVLLLPVAAPPVVEFGVVVALATLLAIGVHLAIARSATLLLLFNGMAPRRRPTAPVVDAPLQAIPDP